MAKLEGEGGGAVGSIWRQHGGGFYALMAVGTFLYLEAISLIESYGASAGIREFLTDEIVEKIVLFGIDTIINSFLAGIWWFVWLDRMETKDFVIYVGAGYVVWSLLLAMALNRREQALKKELGLD